LLDLNLSKVAHDELPDCGQGFFVIVIIITVLFFFQDNSEEQLRRLPIVSSTYPTFIHWQLIVHLLWMAAFSDVHIAMLAFLWISWANSNDLIDLEFLRTQFPRVFLTHILDSNTKSFPRFSEPLSEIPLPCGSFWHNSLLEKDEDDDAFGDHDENESEQLADLFIASSEKTSRTSRYSQICMYLFVNVSVMYNYMKSRSAGLLGPKYDRVCSSYWLFLQKKVHWLFLQKKVHWLFLQKKVHWLYLWCYWAGSTKILKVSEALFPSEARIAMFCFLNFSKDIVDSLHVIQGQLKEKPIDFAVGIIFFVDSFFPSSQRATNMTFCFESDFHPRCCAKSCPVFPRHLINMLARQRFCRFQM
jgi:hypothetical protein